MKSANDIGLIVLAAGASVRLGTPKQLLAFRGETLLRRIARESLASHCRPVVVVLSDESEKFRSELKDLKVFIVENPDWKNGMGSSIKAGLERITKIKSRLEGIVITVCDQPFVTAATINELIETYERNESLIIASEYQSARGVPALFGKEFFPRLQSLESGGAKQIINQFSAETTACPFPDGAIDIDTPGDYAQLSRQFR